MDLSRLELTKGEIAFAVEPSRAEAALRALLPQWGSAVIGQPRALEALRMGVRIRSKGYNVHVSGAPGTGRRTAVLRVLAEETPAPERLRDLVYVYNFESPLEPAALALAAGGGRSFKRDLHRLVESLKQIVALHAESTETKKSEALASSVAEAKENALLAAFEAELAADGFRPVQVEAGGQTGMDIIPLVPRSAAAPKGEDAGAKTAPLGAGQGSEGGEGPEFEETSFEALQARVASGDYPSEEYDRRRQLWFGHMDHMKRLFAELRRGRQELQTQLEALRNEALSPQVSAEVGILVETWVDPKIRAWLESLKKDILGHLYLFRGTASEGGPRRRRGPALARYGVNIVVDREGTDRIPVVIENHPTTSNLFGSVEPKPEDDGDTRTAYLRIRAGSFLKATGGFLVLRAEDVIGDEEAWLRLKRALQDGRVEVQPRESPLGSTGWLKPEAIKADVKVIMIGAEASYDILYQTDPDFQKLFKVHAEFDSSMPLNDEGLRDYAAFARRVCEEEGLVGLDAGGLCALVEQGARMAEYRNRLSTRFGLVADLLREADYRARLRGAPAIDAGAIGEAVVARAHLANLPEEKLGDMISSGEIILQASGSAVGRVNGLAVHDRGYYAFGMPAVISAQVSPGEGGVINIEGESGLSGEIYDKAVLIVEGFLRSRYARDFPLAATASICFEQSYTAVEGDSASSTAVYALLSAIADIGLRQDVAVTGSMNQVGQVQPVGGVCEKVEGFYRICSQAGLTGTQGVMIPRRNVPNLTLSRELQEAIASGSFHVWAVSSIDEGIEVLTGMTAGRPDSRGDFPADSFNGRVRRELLRMAKTVKTYLS